MVFHFVAGLAVLILNLILSVGRFEWLITLMLIGVVWTAEIFNTSLEKLANRINKEHDPLIGQAKDLAAGGVLVICIAAAICAFIIYAPYLFRN
jgi:diacylglycerol kinase